MRTIRQRVKQYLAYVAEGDSKEVAEKKAGLNHHGIFSKTQKQIIEMLKNKKTAEEICEELGFKGRSMAQSLARAARKLHILENDKTLKPGTWQQNHIHFFRKCRVCGSVFTRAGQLPLFLILDYCSKDCKQKDS